MSDTRGWRVIVKINLPPEKQYHAGHSVIFQGDDAKEVEALLRPLVGEDQAKFILLRFAEYALGGAVEQALKSEAAEGGKAAPQETVGAEASQSTAASDLASQKVLEAVAKKTGKSVEELGELTKTQAAELLKGGGK